MGLNIKSKQAHQLAAKLAKLTGQNMTQAVTQALQNEVHRLQRQPHDREARIQRILDIGADIA